MAQTDLGQVQDQIQKFWAPMFMKELREQHLIGSLINKEYQGEIKKLGDTVRVSQINAPVGQLKTAGVDADSFDSQLLTTQYVDVKADKRAVAAFEFEDLVDLQSQIGAESSAIREALLFAVMQQMNNYIYSQVAPSTSAPDHVINGVSDFNAAQLASCRLLAAQAKWMKQKGWWALLSPSYYSDILNAQTLISGDYVGAETPVINGQVVRERYGFSLLEDNSEGILQLSPADAGTDCALLFHPDFMHLVMQTQPTFKVSDLHSNKQFGYVISCDLVFGAKQGIDGNKKAIQVYNT